MRFNPMLISCFSFASVVLANAHRPQQLNLPERSSDPTPLIFSFTKWAGAFWNRNPGTFDFVHAIFAVPNMASVNGVDSYANVLVMIGGDDCPSSTTLVLGLKFHAKPDGSTTDIQAGSTFIVVDSEAKEMFYNRKTLDIPISVGDVIQLEIIVLNATAGYVSIDNLTNHFSVNATVNLSAPLCGKFAGWVISDEADESEDGLYTLANFGTVSFTGASAGTRGSTSSYYQPYGATLVGNPAMIDAPPFLHTEMSAVIAYSDGPLWITYLHSVLDPGQ